MAGGTTSKKSGTALQAPFTFSFMRRGKGGSTGAATTATSGVTAAAAAVSKEDEQQQQQQQQQQQSSSSSPPSKTASTATTTTTSTGGAEGETTNANANNNVVHPYENSIKTICTVTTVEEFWQVYDYLKRPSDLPPSTTTDYHLFRSGIKPTWEDPGNARGGKWIVRLPKGLASRYWEEIVLALLGCGQLQHGLPDGEICGAVLSVRYSEDILGIWNRTASDRDIVERIRDAVKKCLQLPPHFANMEYKPHQTSIADRSSFRNTQVWKPKHDRSASTGVPSSVSGKDGGSGSGGGGGVNLIPAHNPSGEGTTMTSSSSVGSAGAGSDSGGGAGGGVPSSRRSNSWGEERKPPTKQRSDGPGRWRT